MGCAYWEKAPCLLLKKKSGAVSKDRLFSLPQLRRMLEVLMRVTIRHNQRLIRMEVQSIIHKLLPQPTTQQPEQSLRVKIIFRSILFYHMYRPDARGIFKKKENDLPRYWDSISVPVAWLACDCQLVGKRDSVGDTCTWPVHLWYCTNFKRPSMTAALRSLLYYSR